MPMIMPILAAAHLDAGSDDVVNGFLIDFGYAPEFPAALNNTIMNFNLLDNATGNPINFTSLWIRISEGNKSIFAGSFSPSNENVNFLYTFPKGGNYGLTARFYNGTETIVEKDYEFVVKDASMTYAEDKSLIRLDTVYIGLILLIIILFLGFILSRNKLRKKE